ncbi:adenylate kinase isoenzyme 1-like [Dermacentor variabilis]|uniref:adenylate kinase isoenzyme 1-like n=1 Tax=Dermacentor variabilis TaxID=34621 RepID=UPI003F5BFD7C
MEGPLDVKVPVVFVFGGPGSGKGTQCDKIVQKYGFTHISSGDLLRAEVESGSDRGKEINEIMKKGELAPLAMILQLIKEAIKKNLAAAKGFLIDGYPRNVEQGVRFEAEVCKCTNLVYFEVKDETMKTRLMKRGQTSGRVDDNEETIAKRLKTFHDESTPVLEKYSAIVHKISAEEEPDKVFQAVTQLFDEITKPK